ncbi:glycosyltransferase family 2 protein [Chryseobacterium gallinarum]|uniref:glycosyltransferase family 2 protein n=1 Tax=Chryseobacterium gallinarum TaxID=1324352 RepID=UPI00202454F8|nr:glycosyltransferase family A protein [Chryseobacterium gallinarum]MCL8535275.1 glycosyltransferase family 2 protein [Chryseobacterium gallinarum]
MPEINEVTLSVVIPAFNARDFIDISIESVLRQQVHVDEIIIVDDGSTDDTALYIQDKYPMVKLIQQNNGGVSKARNTGVAHSNSKYVSFLDADDEWRDDTAKTWKRVIKKETGCKFLAANYTIKDWNNKASGFEYDVLIDNPISIYSTNNNLKIWTGAVCIERETLNKLGGFDENLRNGEDIDLWLRLMLSEKKIYYVAEPVAKYNFINDESITSTINKVDFKNREKLIYKYLEEQIILTAGEKQEINNYFSNAYNNAFINSLFELDFNRLIKILKLKNKFKLSKPSLISVSNLLFTIIKKKK